MQSNIIKQYCDNLTHHGRNQMVEDILIKEYNTIGSCLNECYENDSWVKEANLLLKDLQLIEKTLKSIGYTVDEILEKRNND